jgi:hypothetical protein
MSKWHTFPDGMVLVKLTSNIEDSHRRRPTAIVPSTK